MVEWSKDDRTLVERPSGRDYMGLDVPGGINMGVQMMANIKALLRRVNRAISGAQNGELEWQRCSVCGQRYQTRYGRKQCSPQCEKAAKAVQP